MGDYFEVSGIIITFANRNKSTQSKQEISNEHQNIKGKCKGVC